MIFFKKIVITKIITMMILCVFFTLIIDYKTYQLVYLFNLFFIIIVSMYIYVIFNYMDNSYYNIKKYILVNIVVCILLMPVLIFVFNPLMSVVNCLLLSLSISDGVYFGFILIKYGRNLIVNNNLIKLIIGNSTEKK